MAYALVDEIRHTRRSSRRLPPVVEAPLIVGPLMSGSEALLDGDDPLNENMNINIIQCVDV